MKTEFGARRRTWRVCNDLRRKGRKETDGTKASMTHKWVSGSTHSEVWRRLQTSVGEEGLTEDPVHGRICTRSSLRIPGAVDVISLAGRKVL